MTVPMTVHVDLESIDSSRQPRPATGRIHVRLAGVAFPSSDWYDFVVVLLGWWTNQVAQLLKHDASGIIRFMEGPYEIKLESAGRQDVFQATALYKDLPFPRLPKPVALGRSDLATSLRKTSEAVLAEFRRRGLDSRDLRNLADGLMALKQAESVS